MPVQNIMVIHSIVVEIFQSGTKWQTNRHCFNELQLPRFKQHLGKYLLKILALRVAFSACSVLCAYSICWCVSGCCSDRHIISYSLQTPEILAGVYLPPQSYTTEVFLLLFAVKEQAKIGICCWLQMRVQREKSNLDGGVYCDCGGGKTGRVLYHHSNPTGGIFFPLSDEIDSCDYSWLEPTSSPIQPTSTQTVHPTQTPYFPVPSDLDRQPQSHLGWSRGQSPVNFS